jgi:hypothetical protein
LIKTLRMYWGPLDKRPDETSGLKDGEKGF